MVCENCQRDVTKTLTWVGDGGALALVHGGGRQWCERCVLTAQLDRAKKMAAEVFDLQVKLAELKD